MALDTGRVTDLHLPMEGGGDPARIESYTPSLSSGPDIGSALRAAREFRGLSLEQVAEATRIRRSYLAAIEAMRLDELPSRPFTIGYVRAYAAALGLDGEAAVERFKADEPCPDAALPEPIGVPKEKDPRLTLFLVGGALVIGAILAWNLAQRAMAEREPPAAAAPAAIMAAPTPAGPVELGAPLPPPVESTTPTPYVTPGLAEATAAGGSSDAVEDAKRAGQIAGAPTPDAAQELPAAFTPSGAVYGAAAEISVVTLQARKPGSLIVRGADGSVYFARQLSAGEAYRAPALKGLSFEVSDPHAFQVFVGGQSKGLLPAVQTPVAKLVG
ncbi:MAG: helix-turn-helix domain-containing protein [Phenylobacterium sp.]|uniref:helix-turn-helix domain-containing protein n=1 Tax=Phenylobacterium sp. TaxID=1871053 RepID=UPI00391A825A